MLVRGEYFSLSRDTWPCLIFSSTFTPFFHPLFRTLFGDFFGTLFCYIFLGHFLDNLFNPFFYTFWDRGQCYRWYCFWKQHRYKEICYSTVSSFSAVAFSSSKGPSSSTCTLSVSSSWSNSRFSGTDKSFSPSSSLSSLCPPLCRERCGFRSCTASGRLQRSNLDQTNPSDSDPKGYHSRRRNLICSYIPCIKVSGTT